MAERGLPRWLVAAVVMLHALPLILFAAALLPEKSSWSITSRLVLVVALCITVAWLVHATMIAPLVDAPRLRFQPLLSHDVEIEFRLWKNRSLSRLQTWIILGWAAWWNVSNPIFSREWGARNLGPPFLVPNLLACAFVARAFLRFRNGRDFIACLEVAIAWAAAVFIPVVNTTAFLTGADRQGRAEQVDVEAQGGHELWLTYTLVGVVLAMQPFSMIIQIGLLGCNAVASGVGTVLCALYCGNWLIVFVRLHVLMSIWVGFGLMQLVLLAVIKPAWIHNVASPVRSCERRCYTSLYVPRPVPD